MQISAKIHTSLKSDDTCWPILVVFVSALQGWERCQGNKQASGELDQGSGESLAVNFLNKTASSLPFMGLLSSLAHKTNPESQLAFLSLPEPELTVFLP